MMTLLQKLQYYENFNSFEIYVRDEENVHLFDFNVYNNRSFALKFLIDFDLIHSTHFDLQTYENILIIDLII